MSEPSETVPQRVARTEAGPNIVQPRTTGFASFYEGAFMPSTFPTLYPYGVGGTKDAETSANGRYPELLAHIRNCLQYHDQRFATHQTWLFVAFDNRQRGQVSRLSRMRMTRKSAQRDREAIEALTIPSLLRLLRSYEIGVEPDSSPGVDAILKQSKWITKQVVGSQGSRQHSRKELKAYITALGSPAFWVTINPPDVEALLLVHYANGHVVNLDDAFAGSIPSHEERTRIVAANPVAAARYFKSMFQGFMDILVRPSLDGIAKGIFGRALAFYGTIEQQGRGSLHMHSMIWLHDQPDPETLKERLLDPSNQAYRDNFIAFMENLLKHDFDGCFDTAAVMRQEAAESGTEVPELRHPSVLTAPDVKLAGDLYEAAMESDRKLVRLHCPFFTFDVQQVGDRVLRHSFHTSSCWRQDENGLWFCRYDYPKQKVYHTTIDSAGNLLLKRLDENVNGHVDLVTVLIRGNMDAKQVIVGSQGLSCVFYMTKYMTKNELSLRRMYGIVLAASQLQAKYNSVDTDQSRAAQLMVNRCVNKVGCEMEQSAVALAYYLLYTEDHLQSHPTTGFFLAAFDARLKATELIRDGQELDVIPAEESVALERDGDEVFEHNQIDDYIHRPAALEAETPYFFAARYYTRQASLKKRFSENVLKLGDGHPLAHRFELVRRQTAQIPLIEGRSIPRADNPSPEAQERRAQMLLVSFTAFRTFGELRKDGSSWTETLAATTFKSECQRVIDNIELLYKQQTAADQSRVPYVGPLQPNRAERDDEEMTGVNPTIEAHYLAGSSEDAEEATEQMLSDVKGRTHGSNVDVYTAEALQLLENGSFFARHGSRRTSTVSIQYIKMALTDCSGAAPHRFTEL
jgi:hypothetical protein